MRPILSVDTGLCRTCDRCQARARCRTRALTQFEQGDLPVIEASRCLGCQVCIPACPYGAIGVAGRQRPQPGPAA